jgi:hypothetical protein
MAFRLGGVSLLALAWAAAPPMAADQFETRLSPSPLTSRQVADVRHGHFYVQINSQKAPNVAVETGLGGGSPVGKPTTLMPQVHHPNNGAAIQVFALPYN